MKQKIRVMLSHEALMMATKLQGAKARPLSHVVEECIRNRHDQEEERGKNETKQA